MLFLPVIDIFWRKKIYFVYFVLFYYLLIKFCEKLGCLFCGVFFQCHFLIFHFRISFLFYFWFFLFFLFVYFSDVFFTRLRRFVLFLKSCFFKIEYSNVEFYVCFSNRVEWQEFFLSCFQILLLQKFSNAVNKFSCNENVSFVFNCFLFPVKKRLLLLNMIDYTCI